MESFISVFLIVYMSLLLIGIFIAPLSIGKTRTETASSVSLRIIFSMVFLAVVAHILFNGYSGI